MRALPVCIALLAGCLSIEHEIESEMPPFEGEPTAPSPIDPTSFAAFFACMDFGDFQASNMTSAWASLAAQDGTQCVTCHADADFSGDEVAFFDALKGRTMVQLRYYTWEPGTGVIVNDTIPNMAKSTSHPRFNAEPAMVATRDLYNRTTARLSAGNCL